MVFYFHVCMCFSTNSYGAPRGSPAGSLSSAVSVVIHLLYKSSLKLNVQNLEFFLIGVKAKDTESQMPQEGREGVKWELGFAFFRGWEMGFCALGLGFMTKRKNNTKMGMRFQFEQHRLELWDLSWDLKKTISWEMGLGPPPPSPPSRPSLKAVLGVGECPALAQ